LINHILIIIYYKIPILPMPDFLTQYTHMRVTKIKMVFVMLTLRVLRFNTLIWVKYFFLLF